MCRRSRRFAAITLSLILFLCGMCVLMAMSRENRAEAGTGWEALASPAEDVPVAITASPVFAMAGTEEGSAPESPEPVAEQKAPAETDAAGKEAVAKDVFVRVKDYIPDLVVGLKYATADNFTGEIIYDFTDAYLRYGTVEKLMRVQASLKEQGMTLKLWDAFRPTAAQFRLWEVYPDAAYVANPHKGFSSHSRGNTMDLTLVDEKGEEVIMPTGFDDFSKLADRDYRDCSEEAAANALLLEKLMADNGFTAYFGEWWHYTDADSYPVEQEFEPDPGY